MPSAVVKNIILFYMILLFTFQLVITRRNEFQVITFSLNEKRLRQSCHLEGEEIQK